jgi:ribosome biogenesis GTPase A|uniref:GTPase RsgA n=1 Tax=Ignisphaera aggregans TaxID=334771 RepID=A0A7J2U0X1_9CREN
MRLLRPSEILRIVAMSNIVIEIVEARAPLELKSRVIESIANKFNRYYLLVLSKCDLVPPKICRDWVEYFALSHNVDAVCVSTLKGIGIKRLKHLFMDKLKEKGSLNIALFGLPKVGKSSLINALKGKDVASTSPYPGSWGYTKGITIYKIRPNIYVIDTPGYIPSDVRGLEVLIRSKPIELIDNPITIAREILKSVLNFDAKLIENIYGVHSLDPLEILLHIAVKRGWLYKNNKEPNIEEAARTVIRDYLDGKIMFYLLPPTRKPFKPK